MSGWLVFAPRDTTQSAEVYLNEDSYPEADEVFPIPSVNGIDYHTWCEVFRQVC